MAVFVPSPHFYMVWSNEIWAQVGYSKSLGWLLDYRGKWTTLLGSFLMLVAVEVNIMAQYLLTSCQNPALTANLFFFPTNLTLHTPQTENLWSKWLHHMGGPQWLLALSQNIPVTDITQGKTLVDLSVQVSQGIPSKHSYTLNLTPPWGLHVKAIPCSPKKKYFIESLISWYYDCFIYPGGWKGQWIFP